MFEKPENWNNLVEKAKNLEAYKAIIEAMFDDNIVNDVRLMVFEEYTCDVCMRYPNIAADIQNMYILIRNKLTYRWYHSIPGILQGLFQCIVVSWIYG